jgi:hypothetical protein
MTCSANRKSPADFGGESRIREGKIEQQKAIRNVGRLRLWTATRRKGHFKIVDRRAAICENTKSR